jgi:hypothetical protein
VLQLPQTVQEQGGMGGDEETDTAFSQELRHSLVYCLCLCRACGVADRAPHRIRGSWVVSHRSGDCNSL